MKRRAIFVAILLVTAAHVAILLLFRSPILLSNAIQTLPPLIAMVLCLHEADHAPTPYFRRLWQQLSFAFLIWITAQICYFVILLSGHPPVYPSFADFLWMAFAFPIFVVISNTQETTQDWVPWLDIGQACVSVSVLYVLMFSRPSLISVALAYGVQSLSLFVASALRYLVATGREKDFFRNLTIYLGIYAICSAIGESASGNGFPPGSIADVLWTIPLAVFSVLALHFIRERRSATLLSFKAEAFRTRLHGVGAFSLALISIGAGGLLASHRPVLGMLALGAAFVLFASRTSLRESQLHAAHARLERASLHDSLTGLANRALLLRELARCIEGRIPTSRTTFAVLFVDLDRFKVINDSLGHAYGDRLLIQAAGIIRASIRPQDILARLGGDEFVVLIEDIIGEQEAKDIARAVIDDLQTPLTLEGRVTHLNASIGIVLGDQASNGDELLRNADCAMYEAKGMGKGRARTFAPAMLTRVNAELALETDLRQALKEGVISAWYQPIYSLSGGSIDGFEALARWRHPVRGLVSPAEFIPVAEDTGLILELGMQVLTLACTQVRNWNSLHHSNFSVSVNVSASQFADPNLLDDIRNIIRTTRFDPKLLKLEITESVLISGLESVKQVLEGARTSGVEIYLDDFGTGYSSLSYLLDFPFDAVKIDRSFVHNLEENHRQTEVVRMIIQLAANLNKRVIAEGVETPGELKRVKDLGCDLVQGYLLAKPMDPEIISAALARVPTFSIPGAQSGPRVLAASNNPGSAGFSAAQTASLTASLSASLIDDYLAIP
ncbi:MAG TPA: EAL domain-containing protein [Acidisarcina sp.]